MHWKRVCGLRGHSQAQQKQDGEKICNGLMMNGLARKLYICASTNETSSPISFASALTPQLESLGRHRHIIDLIALRLATALVAGLDCGFYPAAALIQAGHSLNTL